MSQASDFAEEMTKSLVPTGVDNGTRHRTQTIASIGDLAACWPKENERRKVQNLP